MKSRPLISLAEGSPVEGQSASATSQGAVSGVIWTTAQRWVVRISGLATVMLLTRILGPEQFGLVSVAMAITPAVYLISDMGFSTYLVQVEELSRRIMSTAFFYSAASGIALVGLFALSAPSLGRLFGEPGAATVVWGVCPGVLFTALASVPTALLRRRMEFRTLAIQGAIGSLVGQALAVGLALAGAGVWALVVQLVAYQAVGGVLAWISAQWRPSWDFSLSEFKRMLKFGMSVVASDGVALLRQWAETAIIGAVLGVTGLGYLNVAQRLITVTQDLSASAIVPVSTVMFAKVRALADDLLDRYLRALATSYAIVMPFLVFVAVGAPSVIRILFGPGWDVSVVPAQALSIAGILTLGASLDGGLFYGTGRPGLWFVYATAVDASTVASTAIGVRFGLVGTSIGFVCVAIAATVARWFVVGHYLKTSAPRVAVPILRTSLAGVASAAIGVVGYALSEGMSPWLRLAITGLLIVAAHTGMLRVSAPSTARDVARILGRQLGKIGSASRRMTPERGVE